MNCDELKPTVLQNDLCWDLARFRDPSWAMVLLDWPPQQGCLLYPRSAWWLERRYEKSQQINSRSKDMRNSSDSIWRLSYSSSVWLPEYLKCRVVDFVLIPHQMKYRLIFQIAGSSLEVDWNPLQFDGIPLVSLPESPNVSQDVCILKSWNMIDVVRETTSHGGSFVSTCWLG